MNAKEIKEYAKSLGADIVGIASMDRFEGAPPQMDPRFIMPEAKSMIVMGFRVMRGSLRGIEEGTFFSNYSAMGYGGLTYLYIPMTVINLCKIIEDEGYEAIPIGHQSDWRAIDIAGDFKENLSKPVAPGMPRPDIMLHLRICGYLAGLGEIGFSKMFLTPEFGPRQRLGVVLTEMELEPDPIYNGPQLCNKCMACVRECPAHAIKADKTVKVTLAGNEVEWSDIDVHACDMGFRGGVPCNEGEEGTYYEGRSDYKPGAHSPFYNKPKILYNSGQAVCGARGCTRACMTCLEARGVLSNKFHKQFRRKKQWSVDWSDYKPNEGELSKKQLKKRIEGKVMKFAVGYQFSEENEMEFTEIVLKYKDSISEVYFPWIDNSTGRGSLANNKGYFDWSVQNKLVSDLKKIKSMGIKLDLLFNGNCYGEDAMSVNLANHISSVIDYLDYENCGIDILTTTSPAIAHIVKTGYPNIEVRASINMRIGTVKGMQYMAHLFDSFYVQRDYNRDLKRIEELKKWADKNGKGLYLLANSGCMSFCSCQTFHDNMVAHNSQIEKQQNLSGFNPHACWSYLRDKDNWVSILQNTWIRPEDIHNYEKYFDTVKLATRMHQLPAMVIDSYVRGKYYGNLLDLFEPGYGPALAPYVIDNSKFPADWFLHTSECDKKCDKCNYCTEILKKFLYSECG